MKGKHKPKPKVKRDPVAMLEATIERLRQANDNSELVLVKPGRPGEAMYRVRRFRDAAIERMLRARHITFAQWYAADWYRGIYEQAGITQRTTANYGGAGVGECSYGMPQTERQARCREKLRQARDVIGDRMLGLIDHLILEDQAPLFRNGAQRKRYGKVIGNALQPLADWIGAPVHE